MKANEFLFNFADFLNFSNKQNIIKCLQNMYSFIKIYSDRGDLQYYFGRVGGVDF